jgi:hypothetical protein
LLNKLNNWSPSSARKAALGAVVAFLLSSLAPPSATAADYIYGEHLLRLGDTSSDSPPLLATQPIEVSRPAKSGDLEERLRLLEGSAGPYAPALAEDLGDMAREYRAVGQLSEALRLYRRALHIVRVNDGLYSERQAPLVRAELDIYRASGDLDELDRRYDYYFRLFGSGRAPFTDLRLRATLGYLRWQREATRLHLDGRSQGRLLDAVALNRRVLDDVTADPQVPFEMRVEFALSQLKNLYLVREKVEPPQRTPYAYQQPASAQDPAQWSPQEIERQRAQRLRRTALEDGVAMLEEVIAGAGENARSQTLARLHLAIGDWYQWNDRPLLAEDSYREVLLHLAGSGAEQYIEEWLGEPVELPANGVFRQLESPGSEMGDDLPLVKLAFAVSADGRARDIELVSTTAASEGRVVRAKRTLRRLRFRPRWIAGRAEAVTGLQREYVLPP